MTLTAGIGPFCARWRALKLKINVPAWWAERADEPRNERLLRFFRAQLFHADSAPVIIFCDEIDSTLTLDFTDDFFTAVRAMYNARGSEPLYKKITFCMIGVAAPNELVKEPRTTPYNVGEAIELRDFDAAEDDLTGLVRALCADPATGQTLLAAILRWTDGHPYLTLKLIKEVSKKELQTAQAVDDFVRELFANLHTASKDVHFQELTRW